MNVRWAFAAHIALACALAQDARAERYNLERCLDVAMNVSTDIGIARERLRTSRSGVLRSYAAFMPNLNVGSWLGHSFAGPSASLITDAQGRPIRPAGFDYPSYSFQIQSQMTVFDWGANLNQVGESKRSADAAAYDLEYRRDAVKALVIREYYELVRQSKLREVQEANVEAKRRNLEQVEAFYRVGSRTKADFLQARVDLSNTELELLNRRNAEALAEARLKSRLNLPQDAPLEIDVSTEFTPLEVELTAEVEHTLQHRSDLLAGRQRIEAAGHTLSVAQKGRFPTVDASFQYSWNDREFPDGGDVFERDYVWSVGVFLNWDIFDRFQTKSSIQEAKAQHRIVEYNLQQAKIEAVLEVKQIVLNLGLAQERLDLAQETVAAAEENLRLAEERYRVGAGTILETIEASASLTSAQASLIDANIDYLVNRADLQRATGRSVTTR